MLVILCGICCIWGIGQFISLVHERSFDIKTSGIWSFFNNPNIFANYLIMMLPVNILCYFLSEGYNKKISFGVICLTILSVILTISRLAYFVLMLQLLVIFFICRRRMFLILIYLLAFFFIIISISYLTLQKKYEPRFDIWNDSIMMISKKPISGFGLSGWKNFFHLYKKPTTEYHFHSHNFFLQVAIQGGIIYLFLWLWLFTACVKYFLTKPSSLFLSMSIFSFLFHNIFDYFLNIPILGIMFFMFLGMNVNSNFSKSFS